MILLNNRFFLRDAIKWMSLTMLVCALIFLPIFGIPGGWSGIQAAFLILLIGLVFMVVGALLFALIMGNRVGKPGAVGAGVIGQSQESTTIEWGELRKVNFYPAHRVIFLKGDIFSRIRLYCTPANYAVAEQIIRKQLSIRTSVKVF